MQRVAGPTAFLQNLLKMKTASPVPFANIAVKSLKEKQVFAGYGMSGRENYLEEGPTRGSSPTTMTHFQRTA
jgi:hypothetical protein